MRLMRTIRLASREPANLPVYETKRGESPSQPGLSSSAADRVPWFENADRDDRSARAQFADPDRRPLHRPPHPLAGALPHVVRLRLPPGVVASRPLAQGRVGPMAFALTSVLLTLPTAADDACSRRPAVVAPRAAARIAGKTRWQYAGVPALRIGFGTSPVRATACWFAFTTTPSIAPPTAAVAWAR